MTTPIKNPESQQPVVWWVLVRENKVTEQPGDLTTEEKLKNKNLPTLIHWDRSSLPAEGGGYYHIQVQPVGPLK